MQKSSFPKIIALCLPFIIYNILPKHWLFEHILPFCLMLGFNFRAEDKSSIY